MNPSRSKPLSLKSVLLIALLAIGVASCSSMTPQESTATAFDEVETTVKSVVKDPDRAEKLLVIIHQLEEDLKQQSKELEKYRAAIFAKNADYNASRADMEQAYGAYEKQLAVLGETLITADRNMKALATAEEWAEISNNKNRLGGY